MEIFTKVMGYDGTQELRYELALETQGVISHVLPHMSPGTLAKLLDEWGFRAELKREDGKPPRVESRTDRGQLEVLFGDETREGSNDYQVLTLRAFRRVEADGAVELADRLNQSLSGIRATIHDDRNLVLEQQILMHGGATADHLQTQFELLPRMIGKIAKHARLPGRPLTEAEREEFARRRLEAALAGDASETLGVKYQEYEIIHGRPIDLSGDDEMDEVFESSRLMGVPAEEFLPKFRGRYRKWIRLHPDVKPEER